MSCVNCATLTAETERLKQANEHWHQRMSFVKTDTEALTAENARLKERIGEAVEEVSDEAKDVIADLRAQLAQVERERDEWNKKHLSLCHVVIELREQLAASEAKVKELEKVAR